MRKKLFIPNLLVLAFVVLASGCASHVDNHMLKGMPEDVMYNNAENFLAKNQFVQATKTLEALDARFPFSPHTQQAQLDIIYAYYKSRNNVMALAAADRYIHLYPRGKHVDYAYFMRGVVNFEKDKGVLVRYLPLHFSLRDQTGTKLAFNDFKELVTRFPHSPYVTDARQHMFYLRNMLAKNEIHIAQYYMHRKAYIAALNRASYVVKHFQGTTSVRTGMSIMEDAYTALDLSAQAHDVRHVIEQNYM